jgi:hypothetical protein
MTVNVDDLGAAAKLFSGNFRSVLLKCAGAVVQSRWKRNQELARFGPPTII